MSLSSEAIDRIVANVLNQISPSPKSAVVSVKEAASVQPAGKVSLNEAVITAELMEQAAPRSVVVLQPRAIVTPAAWDVVKSRQLQVQRGDASHDKLAAKGNSSTAPHQSGIKPLLAIVRSTKPVEQLWEGLSGSWKRELLGCPDDAAKLAIGEICRGGTSTVVIVAEQSHRAACLANRNDRAKAVAVQGAGDVKLIRKQLRANVWCIDPTGRSFFELKNLIQQIEQEPKKSS